MINCNFYKLFTKLEIFYYHRRIFRMFRSQNIYLVNNNRGKIILAKVLNIWRRYVISIQITERLQIKYTRESERDDMAWQRGLRPLTPTPTFILLLHLGSLYMYVNFFYIVWSYLKRNDECTSNMSFTYRYFSCILNESPNICVGVS